VAFGQVHREAIGRVVADRVEVTGRVSISEVARPAAQEGVDLPHGVIDWAQQPAAIRDFTDPVAGSLLPLT
jgi:hypothetical protein